MVDVGLDALDGAAADLRERGLLDLRGGVAGQGLLLLAVGADVAAGGAAGPRRPGRRGRALRARRVRRRSVRERGPADGEGRQGGEADEGLAGKAEHGLLLDGRWCLSRRRVGSVAGAGRGSG